MTSSETSRIAGPFLRFGSVDYEKRTWNGSVLIVSNAPEQPTLTLYGPDYPAQKVTAFSLDQWNGFIFWRFNLEVPMTESSQTFSYAINMLPSKSWNFSVASYNAASFRWIFTSCNGFSLGVSEQERKKMGGLEPLWNDVLAKHDETPFDLQVGGGDQIYADAVWKLDILQPWLKTKGKENRKTAEWTPEMDTIVNQFYFDTYIEHFSQNVIRKALAVIPMINICDDHDFWDGAGSYPEYLEHSNVFMNLRRIAYRFYLLFQHQTTPTYAVNDDFIGADRSSYSLLRQIGTQTALLMLDARAERTQKQIVSEQVWDVVFKKMNSLPASVRHVVLVSGVPIVYPRLETADGLLERFGKFKESTNKGFNQFAKNVGTGLGKVFGDKTEKGMHQFSENVKSALGKSGMMKSVLNHFGEPELADDLCDHWTSKNHTIERQMLITRLQELSRDKKIRVTFLAGDVHCGGVGKLQGVKEHSDYRLMYQIISSAIGNVPPPKAVLNTVHNNAKRIEFDSETFEEMVELFDEDVNGQKLKNKKLIGRRNYCIVEPVTEQQQLKFSLQVENVKYSDPSCAYSVMVPTCQ